MKYTPFVLFALAWIVAVYLIDSLIAKKFQKIDLKMATLYFMTVSLVGVFGEMFLDTSYNWIIGHPLWHYNYFPIQHGYTSQFAAIIWGIYGFHLYLLHGTLKARWSITKTKHLALIFCLEALLFEAVLTISAKLTLGKYLYYYLPADLWHVSSFQNIPFYFICSLVILVSLRHFRSSSRFYSSMCALLIFVLIFIAK